MRHTRALLGVAGLVAVLAAGCTQTSAGEPGPVESSAVSIGSGEPSASRPSEIDLTGKDPCSLVPESDWPTFSIDKPGRRQQNEEYDSPECIYSNNEGAFVVTLVVTEGVDVWLDGSRNAEVDEIEPVDGFRAITLYTDIDPNGCDVVVDVADGQYLKTLVSPTRTAVPFSESCELAHELAESAMSTLTGE